MAYYKCDGWHDIWKRPKAKYKTVEGNLPYKSCENCFIQITEHVRVNSNMVLYWRKITFIEHLLGNISKPFEYISRKLYKLGIKTNTDWFGLWAHRIREGRFPFYA